MELTQFTEELFSEFSLFSYVLDTRITRKTEISIKYLVK